jgi:hypothetical protein
LDPDHHTIAVEYVQALGDHRVRELLAIERTANCLAGRAWVLFTETTIAATVIRNLLDVDIALGHPLVLFFLTAHSPQPIRWSTRLKSGQLVRHGSIERGGISSKRQP